MERGGGMTDKLELAKELQEYTKVIGSHNLHIQEVANELVKLLEKEEVAE